MANKIKREPKATIRFYQTLDEEIYKSFFNKCRKKYGMTIQARIRLLVANDAQPDQVENLTKNI